MTKKRLLIVPQTDRNWKLLESYLAEFGPDKYELFFLRNALFGESLKVHKYEYSGFGTVLFPPFLQQSWEDKKELSKLILQRIYHGKLKSYLETYQFDAVIVGEDHRGIGGWITFAAKELKIPVIACQEGCKWIFNLHESGLIAIKSIVLRIFSFLLKFPSYPRSEYLLADFSALWGSATRHEAIKRGADAKKLVVTGHPVNNKIPDTAESSISNRSNLKILYIDIPVLCLPRGSVDYDAMINLRKGIFDFFSENTKDFNLIFKTHPLTPSKELHDIADMHKNSKNCKLVTDGTAEKLIEDADMCISLPSTMLFPILLNRKPLVFISPQFRLFDKIIWNPVTENHAGVMIHDHLGLADAVSDILENFKKYQLNAVDAVSSVLGKLDGMAKIRFRELVESVVV